MPNRWMLRRYLCFLIVALLGLNGAMAWGQDDEDEEEPVDATVFSADDSDDGVNDPRRAKLTIPSGGTFRSDRLGGEFVGKPMYVVIQNTTYPFWGVRAIALDQDSPLRSLKVKGRNGSMTHFTVGDVLSRLDDRKLDIGKFKKKNVWQMPELENHIGTTEVRWIKQKQHQVNIGLIEIDNVSNGNGGNSGTKPETP